MKTPLGTEVDLRAGHIVLDGFPALRKRDRAPSPILRVEAENFEMGRKWGGTSGFS